MSRVTAARYVAAGWALELFTGNVTRDHDDLEIAVPAGRFNEIMDAFPGFKWHVEPHAGDRWVCRRDASITLPYSELILRTSDGIPYAAPEVALLFKAKHVREKDQADFQRVLPRMVQTRRSRLTGWLCQVHPDHPWTEPIRTMPFE